MDHERGKCFETLAIRHRNTRPSGANYNAPHEEEPFAGEERVGSVVRSGVLAAALLLAHGVAHADIFHCVGTGIQMYRDSPCPTGTRTAGVTVSAPVEQRSRQDEDLRNEYERVAAQQVEGLRKIQELELEVAELRTALQSMQVAAVPAAVQEPAYAAAPVQQPVYAAP